MRFALASAVLLGVSSSVSAGPILVLKDVATVSAASHATGVDGVTRIVANQESGSILTNPTRTGIFTGSRDQCTGLRRECRGGSVLLVAAFQ
jgi:hypothetical protein